MSTATLEQIKTYSIDPNHSTFRFSVRHMMIAKVHGELPEVTGTLRLDTANPENSAVELQIAAASLTTGNDMRDGHLKSGDFLDIEQYPTIDFKSTKITRKSDEDYEVVGDLTLHGVTKPVTVKVELTPEVASPFGGYKVGVSASAIINREEFGMVYNQAMETGGVLVGKDITVTFDAELDRA